MTLKVTEIKYGYLYGINVQTGRRENFHYSKKNSGNFSVKEGSEITVEYTKGDHQPKKIINVIACKN